MPALSVSVVIPTYNRAALVTRAIDSALRCTEPGDEILVVDDASTDDTRAVVSRYGTPVRLIAAEHGGAGAARNRGVVEARNDLVAFLDSDDEWLPHKLALERRLMAARPDVLYCFSNFSVCDRSGRVYARYLENWHKDARPWSEILGPGARFSTLNELPAGCDDFLVHIGDLYAPLMARLYIGTFTLVFRRGLPGGVPQFPVDLPTFEDWQFFGELAKRGPGAYLDRDTAIQHGHRMPRLTDATVLVQAQTRIKLLERVWGRDRDFLAKHGVSYREILAQQERACRFYTAKELLKAGRMPEARAAFTALGQCPRSYRLLLRLPGRAIRAGGWLVRRLRGLLPAH